jgi:small-conductance mechanosensitive channel
MLILEKGRAGPPWRPGKLKKGTWILTLALGLLIGLLFASPAVVFAQTPEPQPLPEATPLWESQQATPGPAPVSSAEVAPEGTGGLPAEGATSEAAEEGGEPAASGLLEGIVQTRTPVPSATPGPIASGVEELAAEIGLARTEFLGLRAPEWINLGISLLFVLAAYLLGTWLALKPLPYLVRRTQTQFDDAFLKQAGPGLRWLVVLFVLRFATVRLVFLRPALKILLLDVYFVLILVLAFRILWRAIDLADRWYTARAAETGRGEELAPIITLLVRVGRVVAAIIGATVLLSHFGVNVTALTAALGLGGLAFSLAARDTIADAISGFVILVDRPFRIGDRIEIQGVGTWGDVTDIGLRTTRIRTRDNRMVIVPNSVIGANQVVNYTYPDPRYRIETHVGIAYGTDIETARRVIIEAVQHVEGVLPDKPVDALYNEMGDAAMIFRVRWWIESYVDTRRVIDRVHTTLQHALYEAGIESPFPTQNVNLQVLAQDFEEASRLTSRVDDRLDMAPEP